MKRLWLGLVLLAAMLSLGIWENIRIPALTEPIAQSLEEAAQAALAGSWETAAKKTDAARQCWLDGWDLLASTTHHGPMEEIDGLLAKAELLLQSRSGADFSACCSRLAEMVRALGEAHKVNLRNLL